MSKATTRLLAISIVCAGYAGMICGVWLGQSSMFYAAGILGIGGSLAGLCNSFRC